jgi:phage tail sheath protein FI
MLFTNTLTSNRAYFRWWKFMPNYLSPGVYIEEIGTRLKPIQGVSTSTAGFVGETERGPTTSQLITSWLEYQRIYGSYFGATKYLPYAVEGFFKNGGQRCYIARVVTLSVTNASLTLYSGNTPALIIEAIGEGSWGQRIAIRTKKNAEDKTFKLTVFYWKDNIASVFNPDDKANQNLPQPATVEVFENISTDKSSSNFFEIVINRRSNLIRASPPPNGNSAIPTDTTREIPVRLTNQTGTEASPNFNDFKGYNALPSGKSRGLISLEDIDDISILYIPNVQSVSGLSNEVVAQCEKLKDRFAIIDVPMETADANTAAKVGVESSYSALYCPWIRIRDPVSNLEILVPPGGQVAGIYARSDSEKGVHKAPANEVVIGADKIEYSFNESVQNALDFKGINCIREFPGRGIRVWGAKTLSPDLIWKYINVRRLFIFLEKSIEKGTRWVVFEPNNEKLWASLKQTLTEFLTTIWKTGALMGETPQKAFFVKCDRTTMTQEDIDNGRLTMVIGVAPMKPAEFVIFRVSQWQNGSLITE